MRACPPRRTAAPIIHSPISSDGTSSDSSDSSVSWYVGSSTDSASASSSYASSSDGELPREAVRRRLPNTERTQPLHGRPIVGPTAAFVSPTKQLHTKSPKQHRHTDPTSTAVMRPIQRDGSPQGESDPPSSTVSRAMESPHEPLPSPVVHLSVPECARAPPPQRSLLLMRVPIEVMRLTCSFLSTNDVLYLSLTCRPLYATLMTSDSAAVCAFWEQRWRDLYCCVWANRSMPMSRLVHRGELQVYSASLDRIALSMRRPAEAPLANIGQLIKAQWFIDARRGVPVMPERTIGSSKLRIITFSDGGDQPHDAVMEANVAEDVAKGLTWGYFNGYDAPHVEETERSVDFRRAVATGQQVPERVGFGVLLPMYHFEETARPGIVGNTAPAVGEPLCNVLGPGQRIVFPAVPSDYAEYWWMMEHVVMSDVKHYAWTEETKFAACATICSPSGHAAELRLYAGSLQGSFPKFYVKCVATAAPSFPKEDICDLYPEAAELFCGGYGRVEVDVAPRVSRPNFEGLRTALHLRQEYPLRLLWNLVCAATGAVPLLMAHNSTFLMSFARQTFADEADRVLR